MGLLQIRKKHYGEGGGVTAGRKEQAGGGWEGLLQVEGRGVSGKEYTQSLTNLA